MRRKTRREPTFSVRLTNGGYRTCRLSVLRALERLAPFTASAAALPVFSVVLAGTILVSVAARWAAVASVAALLIARAASHMPRREWRLPGGGAATLTALNAAILLTGAATGALSPLRLDEALSPALRRHGETVAGAAWSVAPFRRRSS